MDELTNDAVRPAQEGVTELIERVRLVAVAMKRHDLAARLDLARDRVSRPDTVIAVVGEFKRGKSSLVNGLLGEPACPVDDDMATTTLTVLRHGEPAAFAWRAHDGKQIRQAVEPAAVPALLGDPTSTRGLTMLEIYIENALLARGITLVDTPGVGGLSVGATSTTLGFLHVADALLFVRDASAPVSEAELSFLQQSSRICPAVITVLTKTDLYPEWRRILATDAETFVASGLDADVFPVSSYLRNHAFERRDSSLNQESGYPALLNAIADRVLEPAKARATERSLGEVSLAIQHMRAALVTEEQALLNPEATAESLTLLKAEGERLERLRTIGGRWSTMMNDDFADLVADVDHRFRQAVRQANRNADEAIESSDPGESWDLIAAETRERMAEASIRVVRELEAGADTIAGRIVEALQEEGVRLDHALGRAAPVPVGTLWSARPPEVRFVMEHAATGWASLRGAQSGILVVGMLGGLAGLALSTGALVGIGALFGGKQIFDERKKQVTARRQKARTGIRQFLDDVQFEVAKSMRDLSRELQRQIRDHFAQRISEMSRSCSATAEALQKTLQQDAGERSDRLSRVKEFLETLDSAQRRGDEFVQGIRP